LTEPHQWLKKDEETRKGETRKELYLGDTYLKPFYASVCTARDEAEKTAAVTCEEELFLKLAE